MFKTESSRKAYIIMLDIFRAHRIFNYEILILGLNILLTLHLKTLWDGFNNLHLKLVKFCNFCYRNLFFTANPKSSVAVPTPFCLCLSMFYMNILAYCTFSLT